MKKKPFNPFVEYRSAVLQDTLTHLDAFERGVSPDPERSRVALIQGLGNLTRRAFQKKTQMAAAHLDVAVKAATSLTLLERDKARGGVMGHFAKLELALRRIAEPEITKNALAPGGIVETIIRTEERQASPQSSEPMPSDLIPTQPY